VIVSKCARTRRRRRQSLALILLGVGLMAPVLPARASDARGESTRLKLIAPGVDRVELSRSRADGFVYSVRFKDGRTRRMTPNEFAASMYERQTERPWWQVFLNISSPIGIAWVTIGLLGQILFTGRMVVQWLASEKQKRSTIPLAFWWLSLGGASMLLIYFVWRKDVIGVLGQSAGWFIYSRNLYFLRRKGPPV
jgi:lipid-A-disaccharide synthase-like uncharacterized protein